MGKRNTVYKMPGITMTWVRSIPIRRERARVFVEQTGGSGAGVFLRNDPWLLPVRTGPPDGNHLPGS